MSGTVQNNAAAAAPAAGLTVIMRVFKCYCTERRRDTEG